MQVSVEQLNGLERRLTVQVPAERIDPEILKRLQSMAGKVRLNGFRPGKVPFKMLKRLYGAQVRQEVLGELLQSSFADAVGQEKLQLVGPPRIEPKPVDEGGPLEYTATFEVYPEFEVAGLDRLQVEKPVAEISDADVDNLLESLRQQRIAWSEVSRPGRHGDRLTVDFTGTIDGQDFPNNQGHDAQLVLGASGMLPDFERALTDLMAGTTVEFDATYPATYGNHDLAGKTAHFRATVKTVAEPHLPEINEAFAALFNIHEGGLVALRTSLREHLERELKERIQGHVKQQLINQLLAANDIPVPQALVNDEIERLAKQRGFAEGEDAENQAIAHLKIQMFTPQARQRVALGLILRRAVENQQIKVDEARVRERIATLASTYEEPAKVMQHYEQDVTAREAVRAAVLEDQVMDWLLEQATVTLKPSRFEELGQSGPATAAPAVPATTPATTEE
jgi:trigger factor